MDKICIQQNDPQLMAEGAVNVGATATGLFSGTFSSGMPEPNLGFRAGLVKPTNSVLSRGEEFDDHAHLLGPHVH